MKENSNTFSFPHNISFVWLQMRYVKRVGVWPVGLTCELGYEGPILNNGRVHAWYTNWMRKQRKFGTDMAGFAINVEYLSRYPMARFRHSRREGVMETEFLGEFHLELEQLEPKANNCSQVRHKCRNCRYWNQRLTTAARWDTGVGTAGTGSNG